MSELAKKTYSPKAELNRLQSASHGDIITRAALQIRGDIKEQSQSDIWPPNMEQCDGDMPKSIAHLFQTILSGGEDSANPSERVQRLTKSLGSDLIYAVSCGKNKPRKHILLPFAVKSLTGNVELIQILNRLGHGISYSQLEEIDTALCLQKLALSVGDVAMPGNIHPSVFST